jgi:hypothetical protein
MQITIKRLNGKTISLTILTQTTINQLLRLIYEQRDDFQKDITFEQYCKLVKLTLSGQDLEPSDTLLKPSDTLDVCAIKNGAVLTEINELSLVKTILQDELDELQGFNDSKVAFRALNAILNDITLKPEEIKLFEQHKLLSNILTIRNILEHPCPENHNVNYPYAEAPEEGMIIFRVGCEKVCLRTAERVVLKNGRTYEKESIIRDENEVGGILLIVEPAGLLGLTSREDERLPPITQEQIREYIKYLTAQAYHQVGLKLSETDKIAALAIQETMKQEEPVALTPPEKHPDNATAAIPTRENIENFFLPSDWRRFPPIDISPYYPPRGRVPYQDPLHQALSSEPFNSLADGNSSNNLNLNGFPPIDGSSHQPYGGYRPHHIGLLYATLNNEFFGSPANENSSNRDENLSALDSCSRFIRGLPITTSRRDNGFFAPLPTDIESRPSRSNNNQSINYCNCWHRETLRELAQKGLTEQMLLNRNDGGHEFVEHHCYALIALAIQRGFSVQEALKEIEELTNQQAKGIEYGLCRADVISLTNFWHISALISLKGKGLTAQILLDRNDGGHEFGECHYEALITLVSQREFSVQEALKEIEELNWRQATRICNGEARASILADEVIPTNASQYRW